MQENCSLRSTKGRIRRGAYLAAGTLCVALAAIGIILPMLPTTPLLLLAAACYARSSDRFYNWLIHHRIFGQFIRNYREKGGINLRQKILAISVIGLVISVSVFFGTQLWLIRGSLLAVAFGVSIYLLRLKTVS